MPMRSWRSYFGLLAALLLVIACDSTPQLEPVPAGGKVLAFGDSLTFGTGAAPEQSYPQLLARRIRREVMSAGIPGELSAGGLKRLPALLDRERPDLLILCHGGNDILHGLDLEKTRANLEAMVRHAQRRGIDVVLVGVPARGIFAKTADIYYQVAEATGVPLEDKAMVAIIEQRELRSDQVHPNAAGYALLAERLHQLLVAAGALP